MILVLSFIGFGYFDLLEIIVNFSSKYEAYEIDELVSTIIVFALCMLVFSIRRLKEANNSAQEIMKINAELKEAINEHSEAMFSHGICPKCMGEISGKFHLDKNK